MLEVLPDRRREKEHRYNLLAKIGIHAPKKNEGTEKRKTASWGNIRRLLCTHEPYLPGMHVQHTVRGGALSSNQELLVKRHSGV